MTESVPSAALLVGIDDYSVYDASVGNPPGTSDLGGARNDVRAWYGAARALGIRAEDIVVRTSPPLTAADMPVDATGTDFGPATRDAILDGVRALGERLAGGARAQGILSWSGHGAVASEGAVLCPADTEGAGLTNALSYPALAAALDAHLPPDALTVFLDVCHATAVARGVPGLLREPRRSLGAAPGAASVTLPRLRAQDRVLAACRAYENAHEYHFMGVRHGAFTWAATSALERWGALEQDGVRYVGLSQVALVHRAAALLTSAAFAQVPRYEGPTADADVPMFWPGEAAGAPSTTGPAPDDGREIDPGSSLGYADAVYQINALGGGVIGYLVVVGPNDVAYNGSTWTRQRQYWVWTTGTPFPSGGWTLQMYGQTPPTTITPSQAYVYPSAPFPSDPDDWSVTNGHWFKISRGGGSNGTWVPVGWLKVKHDNGVPNENHWYEFALPNQNAAPWLGVTTAAPVLRFSAEVSLPSNGQIPNASMESESVLQTPS